MFKFTKWMRVALITVLCLSLSLLFVACGEPGEKGDKGDKGDTGAAGVGIVSIAKDSTSGNVDTYKITLTNGSTSTFTVTNGINGTNGSNGQNGQDGQNGQNGADGVSVTNAQIVNGELILSFSKGNPINLGKVVGDNGKDGQNGTNGKDGQDGADGKDGKDGVGIKGIVLSNEGELTITLTNDTPINLGNVKGQKGDDGQNGQDGVSVTGAQINDDGELVLSFSKGDPINLGVVVGAKGDDGVSLEDVTLDDNGNLSVTYGGTTVNLGNIKGQKGDTGEDGVSITGAQINDDGELVLSFSKGDPINLGVVVGAKGDDGVSLEDVTLDVNGNLSVTYGGTTVDLGNIKGQKGDKGDTGLGIAKTEIDANGKLIITYDDETTVDLGVVVGAKGETGVGVQSVSLVDNNLTITLTDGIVYELGNVKGDKGDTGDAGKSAYEIYIQNNPAYTGDEDQWMNDLVNGKLATEQIVKYTVTFNSNGGTPVAPQQVEENKKVVRPADPTREGYTFLGWWAGRDNDEKWVFVGYPVTEPITLTAKWQINSYTLTFDSNGGTPVSADTVVYNTSYTLPKPSKDGFVFAGWLMDGVLYEEESIVVKQDLEVVAKWVNPTYTTTFNVNGGDNLIDPIAYNYGEAYVLPTPTKIGSEFVGWFVGEAQITNGIWKFDHNLALTAKWNAIPYTIDFITNVDSVSCEQMTVYYGQEVVLPTPERKNYVLLDWVCNETPVSSGEWTYAENVVLVASWQGNNGVFEFNEVDGKITLIKYIANDNDVIVPTVVDDKNVVSIDEGTFANNTNITSVAFDGSFTNFAAKMFAGCTNLQQITMSSAWVGQLYTLFGDSIADVPSSLTMIVYATGSASVDVTMWQSKVANHNVTLTLASDVDTIPAEQFFACVGLTNVVIPVGVTSIGDEAFYSCINLQTITLPQGLQTLGNEVFTSSGLASVEIPSTVTDINTAFKEATKLTAVRFEDGIVINYIDSDAFYRCINLEGINIPSSVKNIGWSVFSGCSSLTSIVIPLGVEWIGPYAFEDCVNLTRIEIPSSVITMAGGFDGCENLRRVDITDISAWYNIEFNSAGCNPCSNGADLYLNGEKLTQLVIPTGVKEIKDNTFYGCTSLVSVTIPFGCTRIGSYAFSHCRNLISIDIPEGVISIGNGAFKNSNNLTNVTIPSSVMSIGDDAFFNCGFTSIVIPNNVTSIGNHVFYNCTKLTSVVISSSVTSIGYYVFYNCDDLKIYCEATSQPSGWDGDWNFDDYPVYWYSETQPTTSGNYWHYVDGVVTEWVYTPIEE